MHIRNGILVLLLSAAALTAQAQLVKLDCYQDPLKIPEPPDTGDSLVGNAEDVYRRRAMNYDFHKTLRKITEPSSVTSFATWTWNRTDYNKKNYVLDADLQIPIAIGGKKFGLHTIHVIPRFKVRIFRDDENVPGKPDISLPVRTPSCMASVIYYFSLRNWWSPPEDRSGLGVIDKLMQNKYLGIHAFHHSDGQDGPEFDPLDPNRVNVYNGNFGEQIVFEFILGGRKIAVSEDEGFSERYLRKRDALINNPVNKLPGKHIVLKQTAGREFYWKVSFEEHFRALTNQDFLKYNLYGRHRLNAVASLHLIPTRREFIRNEEKWCNVVSESGFERWRFMGTMNYILDKPYNRGRLDNLESVNFLNASRRLNLYATAYCIMGSSKFTSVFVQAGYYGSDTYNIYFNQSIWQFKFGLAFGFFDQPDLPDKN